MKLTVFAQLMMRLDLKEKLRVFICGTHSTGKTTLLHDVEQQVNITAVPEVARQLIKVLFTFSLSRCFSDDPLLMKELASKYVTTA